MEHKVESTKVDSKGSLGPETIVWLWLFVCLLEAAFEMFFPGP